MKIASFLTAVALTLLAFDAAAHDIPNDVLVHAFVRPAGDKLQLLARVPMAALRDVDFPRRGAGYLDIARADGALADAAKLWLADNIELYEGDARLPYPRVIAARISLESDKSFASFAQALAHLREPRLPNDIDIFWEQGLLDVLLEYPIGSEHAQFSIRPRLERLGLRTQTVLRFILPDGTVRAFEYHGDAGIVRLDPSWWQAAWRFVAAGFVHILEGGDHLLFLLCLVIPFRRFGALVAIVTSFTVAHSITLIGSAYDLAPNALWFPPLIETLIAISILYMGIENVLGTNVERRWMITFAFGLVHGFGFSFALRQQLQFAGAHLLTSLLSFNVGVELGQLLVLVILVPALDFLFRRLVAERIGTIVLSVLVGHTAWHWMLERGDRLLQFPWPVLDAGALATLLRWLTALAILAALLWAVSLLRRRAARAREAERG